MISENINIKSYNTFGIEVFASHFGKFSSLGELKTILDQSNSNELLVLGGGSNILLMAWFC